MDPIEGPESQEIIKHGRRLDSTQGFAFPSRLDVGVFNLLLAYLF